MILGITFEHKKGLRLCDNIFPIMFSIVSYGDWKPIEGHFEKELTCWVGKVFSYKDHMILTKSLITSLPMFGLTFLVIPKGVLRNLIFL